MCNVDVTTGSVTINIDRIGSTGADVPVQLFGASDGVLKQGQEGILAGYKRITDPTLADNDNIAMFDQAGNLLIGTYDAATKTVDAGVRVSGEDISYQAFLEHVKENKLIISDTKLDYGVKASLSKKWNVESKDLFGNSDSSNIKPLDSFEANQFQSLIVTIEKVISVSRFTRMSFLFDKTETRLSFVFTLGIV